MQEGMTLVHVVVVKSIRDVILKNLNKNSFLSVLMIILFYTMVNVKEAQVTIDDQF